ncbi:MAG: DNA methyltransferase [Thermoplasmata archaeon]
MILKNKNRLTVWDFPSKAGKNEQYIRPYRGSFLPEMAKFAIERYSNKNDLVFDPFCGRGTTVIEAVKLGRNGLGYDINKNGIKIAKEVLKQKTLIKENINLISTVRRMDSRKFTKKDILKDTNRDSVDLILTSPPYYNNLKYSDDKEQLGAIEDYNDFLEELNKVWINCFDVLKQNGFMLVVVGDCRGTIKKRKEKDLNGLIPLHMDIINQCKSIGFTLWDIIIHPIYNMNSLHNFFYMKWLKENDFQFISHDYIIVFRKINSK